MRAPCFEFSFLFSRHFMYRLRLFRLRLRVSQTRRGPPAASNPAFGDATGNRRSRQTLHRHLSHCGSIFSVRTGVQTEQGGSDAAID